jgi:CO/xanthine dehydrogenase Mo-binding subunit
MTNGNGDDEIVKRSISKNDHFEHLQKNEKRPEGIAKVTGHAVYADDFETDEDPLYGKTIRSEVPHADIKNINFTGDIPWDEFAVVTAEDIPGKNVVTLIELDQPFLAEDEIRHKAEPVALIAHEDKHLVEKAANHVEIVTDEKPAIFDIEEAMEGEVDLGGEKETNRMKQYHVGDDEVTDETWDECDEIIEDTYRTGAQEQLYIEPNAIVSQVDVDEPGGTPDKVTCWGTMQCPFYIRKALAPLFDVRQDEVRVVQTETGGGFGGKEEYPNMIAGHAALLSWKAGGRPVRLIYDRQEDMWATTKRHPSKTTIKAGFKEDGTLHALDIDFNLNGGGYRTLTSTVLSRGVLHSWGPYQCDNTAIRARSWFTNSNPYGAFRGFGAPQSIFAIELHMNRCAEELGIDPAELRRRNFLEQGDTLPTGQVIQEDVDLEYMLDEALEEHDYYEKKEEFEEFNAKQKSKNGTKRKGINLSFFFHGSGFTGSGESMLASELGLKLHEDGEVEILAGQVEYGQGTITTFTQLTAETLGIPMKWVSKRQPDTDEVPDSGPTVASRTTMIVGKLVEKAADNMLEKLQEETDLPEDHSDEEFKRAAKQYAEEHGEALYVESEYEEPEDVEWDEDSYEGSAYSAYSWTCDVASVEVDLLDYFAKVTDFTSIVECGRVLNPVLAAGQIEGGIAQAIGFALYENCVMEEGEMKNNQYTNYIIPTTADTPYIDVKFIEFPYENYGPYSAKGIGELPIDGPAPGIVGAVAHALDGEFINEIPLIPERIMNAVEDTGPTQGEQLVAGQ